MFMQNIAKHGDVGCSTIKRVIAWSE